MLSARFREVKQSTTFFYREDPSVSSLLDSAKFRLLKISPVIFTVQTGSLDCTMHIPDPGGWLLPSAQQ